MGIDVQYEQPDLDWKVYERLLSPKELRTVEQNRQPWKEFYRIWTMKEAIAKAEGYGLQMMSKIDTSEHIVGWGTQTLNLMESYSTHVCSATPLDTFEIELKEY